MGTEGLENLIFGKHKEGQKPACVTVHSFPLQLLEAFFLQSISLYSKGQICTFHYMRITEWQPLFMKLLHRYIWQLSIYLISIINTNVLKQPL